MKKHSMSQPEIHALNEWAKETPKEQEILYEKCLCGSFAWRPVGQMVCSRCGEPYRGEYGVMARWLHERLKDWSDRADQKFSFCIARQTLEAAHAKNAQVNRLIEAMRKCGNLDRLRWRCMIKMRRTENGGKDLRRSTGLDVGHLCEFLNLALELEGTSCFYLATLMFSWYGKRIRTFAQCADLMNFTTKEVRKLWRFLCKHAGLSPFEKREHAKALEFLVCEN